ncbi:MAG: hypothetical protein AB1489_39380 [Acidobacteriota bacterium]
MKNEWRRAPLLTVWVLFEPNRLASKLLADVYQQVVPISKRARAVTKTSNNIGQVNKKIVGGAI